MVPAQRSKSWVSWLADSVARLLGIHLVSLAVIFVVGSPRGGTDVSSLMSGLLTWAPVIYFGFLVGAVIYLPALLMSTTLTHRWRLMAIALSPVVAAGGLLFILPWSMNNPLPVVGWGVATAAAFGAIVPAPDHQSLRGGLAVVVGGALGVGVSFIVLG